MSLLYSCFATTVLALNLVSVCTTDAWLTCETKQWGGGGPRKMQHALVERGLVGSRLRFPVIHQATGLRLTDAQGEHASLVIHQAAGPRTTGTHVMVIHQAAGLRLTEVIHPAAGPRTTGAHVTVIHQAASLLFGASVSGAGSGLVGPSRQGSGVLTRAASVVWRVSHQAACLSPLLPIKLQGLGLSVRSASRARSRDVLLFCEPRRAAGMVCV